METKSISKYFFFGLLLTTLIFSFFIFKPFLIVLILGMSFAVVLSPIHKWLTKNKMPNWLSAILILILFITVICGPLLIIGFTVFDQTQNVYHIVVKDGNLGSFIQNLDIKINNYLPSGFSFNAQEKTTAFITYLSNNITKIFSTTISTFFSFILILITLFYFIKDGEKWKEFMLSIIPLSPSDNKKIIDRLDSSINGIIKGYLFIALIQGVMMGAGLAIFGVPNAALWGVVAAIASLVPSVGTSIVSIPAIIFLYMTGNTVAAIGMLAWAIIMVSGIDNILNPMIVGKKINVPKLVVLFSVLGGVSLLGPIGILIGPLTVSFLHALISIYKNDFNKN